MSSGPLSCRAPSRSGAVIPIDRRDQKKGPGLQVRPKRGSLCNCKERANGDAPCAQATATVGRDGIRHRGARLFSLEKRKAAEVVSEAEMPVARRLSAWCSRAGPAARAVQITRCGWVTG
jgi:hypothetical protein